MEPHFTPFTRSSLVECYAFLSALMQSRADVLRGDRQRLRVIFAEFYASKGLPRRVAAFLSVPAGWKRHWVTNHCDNRPSFENVDELRRFLASYSVDTALWAKQDAEINDGQSSLGCLL